MVMAYIIFVNPIILGYVGVPGLDGKGLPFGPTLTVTCFTAGLLSIAMRSEAWPIARDTEDSPNFCWPSVAKR